MLMDSAFSILGSVSILAANPLLNIWNGLWPYLLMLAGFSVIVFVHELGHFAVAKWVGVKVERFAIGFGQEIFGFTKGETRYSFNILPLGGYVKMLGQEDFDDKSNELKFKEDPRSFVNKPVGARMAVVSAGVIMNVLFACFLFMIVFWVGMEAQDTLIYYVEPDSPADKAGLVAGDDIKTINGKTIREFNEVFTAIVLAPKNEDIDFTVERSGKVVGPIRVRPELDRSVGRQLIGIGPGITREIMATGPELDPNNPRHPHVGDVLVEVDGQPVTDENVDKMMRLLVTTKGPVYVERKDPKDPNAPPKRVEVDIPPILQLYPSDPYDPEAVNLLGLTPLVRVSGVSPKGRAGVAGIEVGDTVMSWADSPFPTQAEISRSIRNNAERDIEFSVRKPDGEIERGFVRPKANHKRPATVEAEIRPVPRGGRETHVGDEGLHAARFAEVQPHGVAGEAGISNGDVILRIEELSNPTVAQARRMVRENPGSDLSLELQRPDGSAYETTLQPKIAGEVGASFRLVADDLLRTGKVQPTLQGEPSPAARAGIPTGALIVAVDGEPVITWRGLIEKFREHAGSTVELAYESGPQRERHSAEFDIPPCLRSVLGVGPQARILSIAGKEKIQTRTSRGTETVSVGYHVGTREALAAAVGQTVEVTYRPDPLSEIQTTEVKVVPEMVDPWLGRISLAGNIDVGVATTILKGKNPLDAVMIGIHKTYYFILQVYEMMHRMIFERTVGVENISGPLGIISAGGQVARTNFVKFLFFMAIISANLAVINFLPLPIVDGGLMVFLIIEKIKGSPVSLHIQIATQMIGLVLIIGAFVYVTFQDAVKMFG